MDISEIRKKILETGWQSWSPRAKSSWFSPAWNNSPIEDNYLPNLNEKRTVKKPVVGWCSYYAFGANITEEKILAQAQWFSEHQEIPVKYILIDGGWTESGDWLEADPKRFPNGLKDLSDKVHGLGLKLGIWVAPFLVSPNSNLFKNHAEWLARKNGKLILGLRGGVFDSLIYKQYVLDIRKAEVRAYLKWVLNKLFIGDQFQLVKFDYLYSIYCLPGIFAEEAGNFLRNWFLEFNDRYPNVYTIACGCPLLPALNVVDSMRIGPDTIDPTSVKIPIWRNISSSHKLNIIKNNVEKRLWTRKFWNLDPDVFVCRKNLGLTEKQILKLQKYVKLASGNIFLGDDMTKLGEDRIRKFVLPLYNSIQEHFAVNCEDELNTDMSSSFGGCHK